MSYVDGFVAAVATNERETYMKHLAHVHPLFTECGALSLVDCWGDDVPEGKLTSFPMAVKCQPNETVVFGWVTWASREARDDGWKKLMADPRMQAESMPFDGKRMIFGGFQVMLES